MHKSRAIYLTGALIAALLLVPLAFLLIQAQQVGWSQLSPLLLRHLTLTLLLNTIKLTVIVTAACAVIGTATAWCIERTDLRLRRMWAVVVVLPVAIPDFVVGYAWSSAFPWLHGLAGASLVMTLATYPLVYLPVAAALRRTDPALEEAARSLGLGRLQTFWRVTLAQIRTALLGGCLIVSLALLAEYGAFEIMRFSTFTTEIFVEFNLGFDSPAACALALVLVVLCVVVLTGEGAANRHTVPSATPARPPTRQALHRAQLPVLGGFTALIVLSLGVPVGTIVYWLGRGQSTTLPGGSLWSATSHTMVYAGGAAALATAMAMPIALLAVRHPGRITMLLERSTYVVKSLPGLVIALSLVFFSIRYGRSLYQSSALMVVAYALLFFPFALICVRASLAQAPRVLEEMAESLGRSRVYALTHVTLPLVGPGLAAGFCLVFLSAVTELTATLILVPTGVHTLATRFWEYQTNTSYSAAAPYAAILVAMAVIPTYVLSQWFDRRATGVLAT